MKTVEKSKHDTLYRIGRCCSIPPTREHDGLTVYGRIYSVEYPFLTIADYDGNLHSVVASRVVIHGK